MKAVISNRIYIKCDKDKQAQLKAHLTYKIPKLIMGQMQYETVRLWTQINSDIITIPPGRKDLVEDIVTEWVDKRTVTPALFPEFKGTLRDSQQLIHDECDESCIINAQPSWGKTFTAIAIARKLGLKTLIVTHTVFLREQWESEIANVLGIEAGVIGSGKYNTDPCITVANIQSLVKHMDKVNKLFGTIILDEAHHAPASTFFKIMDASKARFRIGLTGTLVRKDGYHVILPDIFSPHIFKPPKENMMDPEILIMNTDIPFSDDNSIPWADRVTQLMSRADYQDLLFNIIDVQVAKGHKVLVVSDRLELLHYGNEIFLENSLAVVGETSTKARNGLQDKLMNEGIDIIFGNLSIFKEGISVPALSCVISTTPINNDGLLEQLIGRICRVMEGKNDPVVIDLKLLGGVAGRQATARLGFYLRQGWKVTTIQ
jgi:superfamily II DNA or RNA helicase